MPRPKGSKNKVKTAAVPTSDFAALIAEKAVYIVHFEHSTRYF